MNFVMPSVELIDEKDNFKRIEIAGRTCYKSEDKITEDSAFPFFQRICKNGHTSVLEHSVIFVRTHTAAACLKLKQLLRDYVEDTGYPHYIRYSNYNGDMDIYNPIDPESEDFFPYNMGICLGEEHLFSGNIHAWRNICSLYSGELIIYDTFCDHPAFSDIFEKFSEVYKDHFYNKKQIEIVDSIPTNPEVFIDAYKHNIATLKIIGDRGVIDEYARHRVCGISIESTRYCNYANNGVTFVFPWWYENIHDNAQYAFMAGTFGNRCFETEAAYLDCVSQFKMPQMARGNLTLWVKSEGTFTATIQQWIDILALRDSPAAHPDAQRIAKLIEEVLVNDVGVKDMWGVKNNGLQSNDVNKE